MSSVQRIKEITECHDAQEHEENCKCRMYTNYSGHDPLSFIGTHKAVQEALNG